MNVHIPVEYSSFPLSSINSGEIAWHGGHQVAKKSTTTSVSPESLIADLKSSRVSKVLTILYFSI